MRYIKFMEFASALKKDKRTRQIMLPLFTFPDFMKYPFGMMAPILGIDGQFPTRFWGTTVTFDVSKAKKDLALDTYEPVAAVPMLVDMALAFKKFKIGNFSPSMARYN